MAYVRLGYVYIDDKQIQKSIDHFEKAALQIARKREDKNIKILAQFGLGRAYGAKTQDLGRAYGFKKHF